MKRTLRADAFTLLELMLSTMIVAVLTLALYAALYAAFHARETAQSQVVGIRAASIALDLIEQNLKSVEPPNITAATNGTSTFAGPFMGYASSTNGGNSAEIDFYTLGHDFDQPASLFADGPRHVQLMLMQDGTTSQLVREINRNLLSPNGEVLTEEVLASNVTSFTVQYYDGTTWTDTWDSTATTTLPVAVDVTIEVQDDTRATDGQTLLKTVKASRMIVLPCAQTADQVAAAAAASTSDSSGTSGGNP